MEHVAIFLAAVAPGLLMLAYGVAKTRIGWRNEALYSAVLAGGVGASLVTLLPGFEDVFPFSARSADPLVTAGVTAVLVAAIPEEGVKFLILFGATRRDANVRRLQDIVALALGVSIGTATFENLAYVVFAGDWRIAAIARSLLAVPGHGINGLIMGALLTSARLGPHRPHLAYVIAFAVPVVTHAAYDFPLIALQSVDNPWLIVVWLAVLFLSAGLGDPLVQ
jgi:RsiW-degrading membrane proteinase PrsW (M82 family)